jgi:hypothetical protein
MSWRRALLGVVVLAAAACAADTEGGSGAPTGGSATSSTVAPSSTRPQPTLVDSSAASTGPAFPADAAALAIELSTVEAAIRATGVSADELAVLGRRQQLAYRAVNQHPEWQAQLTGLVEPVALTPLAYHLAARQAQIDHAEEQAAEQAAEPPASDLPSTSVPAPTLPAWTIVEPLPIEELRGYYAEAEAATGVPWQYLAAIHFQETRMGRVVGVSSAGAVGPMQFLPSTWQACCEGDPTVARDAILGAARYLAQQGAPGDMQAALYGYNPNSAYVGAVTAYAQNMIADERAYDGYHGWEVFYATSEGTVRLPVGYSATAPVDLAAYLRDRPEDLLPPG